MSDINRVKRNPGGGRKPKPKVKLPATAILPAPPPDPDDTGLRAGSERLNRAGLGDVLRSILAEEVAKLAAGKW
jgi:hypothetical protein